MLLPGIIAEFTFVMPFDQSPTHFNMKKLFIITASLMLFAISNAQFSYSVLNSQTITKSGGNIASE